MGLRLKRQVSSGKEEFLERIMGVSREKSHRAWDKNRSPKQNACRELVRSEKMKSIKRSTEFLSK